MSRKRKINVAVLDEIHKVFIHSETAYGYLVSKEEKPIKLFHVTTSQVTP